MTDTPTPAPQPAPEAAATTAPVTVTLDSRTMAIAVYALYLAGFFTAFISAIAGVIIAYAVRKDAPDWLKSHFTFQIRTFWIGLAASIVGGATVWVLGLGFLILLATGLWFLVRSVAGLGQALNNKAYPNPEGWLI
jgi:uncharacterized membrane protein